MCLGLVFCVSIYSFSLSFSLIDKVPAGHNGGKGVLVNRRVFSVSLIPGVLRLLSPPHMRSSYPAREGDREIVSHG